MTRIIIDDVTSIQDLVDAVAVVHTVFAADPAKFDSEEEYFSKRHPEACTCDACLEAAGIHKIREIAAPDALHSLSQPREAPPTDGLLGMLARRPPRRLPRRRRPGSRSLGRRGGGTPAAGSQAPCQP